MRGLGQGGERGVLGQKAIFSVPRADFQGDMDDSPASQKYMQVDINLMPAAFQIRTDSFTLWIFSRPTA
jgi:hypothetical protein